jgi:hypothetical protein
MANTSCAKQHSLTPLPGNPVKDNPSGKQTKQASDFTWTVKIGPLARAVAERVAAAYPAPPCEPVSVDDVLREALSRGLALEEDEMVVHRYSGTYPMWNESNRIEQGYDDEESEEQFRKEFTKEVAPVGSLWRRGSQTYKVVEHDDGMIVYRNLRARPGQMECDTVHAFHGPEAYFRRLKEGTRAEARRGR